MQTEQTSKITNEQKDFTFVKKRKCERKGVKNNKKYTANVYRALRVFAGFPCFGETLYYLGKSYNYHGVTLQSVSITQHI